jgi:AcrR family transcriptional regulator
MPSSAVKVINLDSVSEVTYKLFEEYGIDKVTKEMIAKESGLSRKTIDRYFPDKTSYVLHVVGWVLEAINNELQQIFTDEVFKDGHTGAQLLQMYMEYLRDLFLKKPKIFVLYTEFRLYIYRNFQNYEQQYARIWGRMDHSRLRCKIYEKGKRDGSFSKDLNTLAENKYIAESFVGFLSNLAISFNGQSKEEMENQINMQIADTIEFYTMKCSECNKKLPRSKK